MVKYASVMFGKNTVDFNPETEPETTRLRAGSAEIFIVNQTEIFKTINKGGAGENELVLDAGTYEGPVTSSELVVKQQVINRGRDLAWIYSGKISYDANSSIGVKDYFHSYTDTHDTDGDTDECYASKLFFNNLRLLSSKKAGLTAFISVYEQNHNISYLNDDRLYAQGTFEGVEIALSAPTVGKDRAIYPEIFRFHLQHYVVALNALAVLLEGQPRLTQLVVTADGPLYPTETPGKYSKKPQSQKREHIEIGTPKDGSQLTDEKLTVKRHMLDDIGGLESVRTDLKRVVHSFKHPEAMARWKAQRPQGILLYGPPGTGKTSLAQALANEIEGELWEIQSPDIFDKWLGNSEKKMKGIFEKARQKTKPTVMFFDEFDGLIRSEGDGSSSRTAEAVLGIFKTEVTTLRETNPNIIMVAATNHKDNIDESLIRAGRFDMQHYIALPDDQARRQIFSNNIGDLISELRTEDFIPLEWESVDMAALVSATEGMSGADIVEVLRRVSFEKAMAEARGQIAEPISQEDLMRTIRDMRAPR